MRCRVRPRCNHRPAAIVARKTGEGACRPDHRHGRLPLGRSARRPVRRRCPWAASMSWPRDSWKSATRAGAKVILQGPCTYEVDSPAGGFLSLGKLTARVEREKSGENPKSKIRNLRPLSPFPSPLSPVRCPHSHRRRHRPGHRVRRGSGHVPAQPGRTFSAGGSRSAPRPARLSTFPPGEGLGVRAPISPSSSWGRTNGCGWNWSRTRWSE